MLASVNESWNVFVLEQVMCLVSSTEDTIWDFDMGNQWALHVSLEMLSEYVVSFRMARNSLLPVRNRQILSYTITLAMFVSEYLSSKQTLKEGLNFDSKMIPCNNV